MPPAPLRPPVRRLLRSGLLEALAAPHGVDRYVELVHPTWSLRDPPAEIVDVRRQSAGSVTLTLRPDARWHGFRAGQFIRLTVEIAGVRETRCYSPACGERAGGEIELTVKAHPAGKVSRYLNERARPGMLVGLSLPDGGFVLPHERPERLLLISGGSGITPVMSLLRTLRDEGHEGRVTFLHYARAKRYIPYRRELQQIATSAPNVRVALVCTRERGVLGGHLSRRQLHRVAPDYARAHTYLCGPPSLIAAVRALWAADGIEQPLHIESFQPVMPWRMPRAAHQVVPRTAPEGSEGSAEGSEGSVYFAGSDVRAPSDGRWLLEQAERAGLCPPCGCRMGICRMCTTRKRSGSVRNVLSGEVSSGADEDIQICVSRPVGDVELAL
jgi:stearoyl-CoA 9-desaturase NADPH oxidoreductase